ncbi:MAG TPA: hypothetical protein VK188_10470 [Holophaga sp.]|nr:hypothetical protein [Holophaga sp.]
MRIANPIYDVVFKFLLDDEKVARLLLGALLGREILELQFRPTEVRHESGGALLVFRMDFAAVLRMEDGSRKLVLLEIQKAQSRLDVMRFRRYLGGEYANPDNVYHDHGRELPLPLVTIYFLGEGLEGVEPPVVRVKRHYHDAATGEELRIADALVEALTHDSVVVQINRLKGRRRTDLERPLMVFDQDQAPRSDPHFLEILEESFPARFREVLNRLLRASAEQDVRTGMDVEDDVVSYLQEQARTVAEKDEALEESRRALEESRRALEESRRALEEQRQVNADKDRHLAGMTTAIADLARALDDLRRAPRGT